MDEGIILSAALESRRKLELSYGTIQAHSCLEEVVNLILMWAKIRYIEALRYVS